MTDEWLSWIKAELHFTIVNCEKTRAAIMAEFGLDDECTPAVVEPTANSADLLRKFKGEWMVPTTRCA